jgi:hypothetical protein
LNKKRQVMRSSFLSAGFTQMSDAITAADKHFVGLRHFPLTFGSHEYS